MASAHQPEEAWKEPSTALNKSSLVPLWIIQSAVLLLYIGVLSWEFSSLGWYPGYDDEAFSPLLYVPQLSDLGGVPDDEVSC